MAAGFKALRDEGIDSPLFEPDGLGGGGRGADHAAADGLYAAHESVFWKAEVKADNLRLEFLDHLAECHVKGRPVAGWHRSRGINPKLVVIRLQHVAPSCFARIVGNRGRAAEKIDIDRALGSGREL